MHIKPRAIATVLCMIFFIGFAVCGVVRSTDKETSEIKYKVCSDENPHECEHLIETEKL